MGKFLQACEAFHCHAGIAPIKRADVRFYAQLTTFCRQKREREASRAALT